MGTFPKPKFTVHKHKDEIIKRWNAGQNPYQVFQWLETLPKEDHLTLATLSKYYKKHMNSIEGRLQATKKQRGSKVKYKNKSERYLWDTVEACRDMKKFLKEKGQIREWQMVDQQEQAALKLLADIEKAKTEDRDFSEQMSKFVQEMMQNDKETEENTTADSPDDRKDGSPEGETSKAV